MRLTDAQYERIERMLPTPRGRLTVPQRQVMDELFYIAKEDSSWRGLPPEFGPWHTISMRLNRWAKAGVLERVVSKLQRDQLAGLESDALLLDSTIIKLHADGAGGCDSLKLGGVAHSCSLCRSAADRTGRDPARA